MCLCNSFPEICSETSARARKCAWFCAKTAHGECPWLLLGFTNFGESAVTIGGLAAESKPPIRPDAFIISGLILRFVLRFRNRRMKPPFSPLFSGWILRLWSAAWPPNETAELDILGRFLSRAQFCGQILRPRPQNETADCAFQGQNCLFTCPVSWCYKYHTFSFL